jgi:SAM-dependent methyltransferase
MKILILADEPGWIIGRITDRMIEGIPFEFTKKCYLHNTPLSISKEEFLDLGFQHDLIHFQNWGVVFFPEGLKELGYKTLMSIRSFRYPPELFPVWSTRVKRVHVLHPELLAKIPNSVYIPDGIFDQYIPQHEFTVGFAGVQDDYKGFNLIKKACDELGARFKPAWGIPPDKMPDYYKSIDLYVCASYQEGFANPVMECLAMNKPVLTTDVGVPSLHNIHKCERSLEGIKKGIGKFYTYPQVKEYSWKNVCLQFKKLYEDMMSEIINDKTRYEMYYWLKTGQYLDPIKLYTKLLNSFGLTPEDLSGKVILDAGSGPFGGITCLNSSFLESIAVDPMFDYYEKDNLLKLKKEVQKIPMSIEDVPLDSVPPCDYIFSINALDHSTQFNVNLVEKAVNNMVSMLKPGGSLCIWVHLRTIEQLNLGHDFQIQEKEIEKLLSKNCNITKWEHTNDENYKVLIAKAERK